MLLRAFSPQHSVSKSVKTAEDGQIGAKMKQLIIQYANGCKKTDQLELSI